MFESQLKKHHFLHWTTTSPFVTFQVRIYNSAITNYSYIMHVIPLIQEFERYDSNGPKIDINNESDQKFVWMIPINQNGSNQFSLRPYDQTYYLKRGSTIDGDTEQAVVAEGGSDDEPDYYELQYMRNSQ